MINDLIKINRKYDIIFNLLTKILITTIILQIITTIMSYIFPIDIIFIISLIFGIIIGSIAITSLFFGIKGKTEQIKNKGFVLFGKFFIMLLILNVILFPIIAIFDNITTFDIIMLFFSLIVLTVFLFEMYNYTGVFNFRLLLKAHKLRDNGDYDKALEIYKELESENYEYPSVYNNLGFIYEKKRKVFKFYLQ